MQTAAVIGWQDVATAALAALQALWLTWLRQSAADREALRERQVETDRKLATLSAHVGVDGNGIMARLDTIETKLDVVVQELAEQRGARRGRE